METKDNKFHGSEQGYQSIPGTHRVSGYVIEDGIYKYKVYDPGRCEIILEIYLTDGKHDYGDCLTKLRFLDIIKKYGLTDIKRVVNIVSIETREEYRNQGIATSLLLDFLKGYRTSKTDIVVAHCPFKDDPICQIELEEFYKKYDEYVEKFVSFFEPFGFRWVPDMSETGHITLTNSYLFLSHESEAAKSLHKIFVKEVWRAKG